MILGLRLVGAPGQCIVGTAVTLRQIRKTEVDDLASGDCAIIDPVPDDDERSGQTATTNADALLAFVARHGQRLQWILDSHPHADHFSAAPYLKGRTGAPTAIGKKVREVQTLWKDIYDLPDLPGDGSQWDRLFAHGETFQLGQIPSG